MKKIFLSFFTFVIFYLPSSVFGQANTYFHDRIDTTIFAVADTVGHGANHYYAINTSADFNVKQYLNGCAVNIFVKKGNIGNASLTLVTKTGILSAKTIKKANGQNLSTGDIKDSTVLLFTFYGSYWRCDPTGNTSATPTITITGAGTTTVTSSGVGTTTPSYTVSNTASITSVVAGSNISVNSSANSYTVTNTAPDQTVTLTPGTGISVNGTYPTFTVTNTSPSSGGTVTSVTVTPANGVSGIVSNPTTTPALTLSVTPNVSNATGILPIVNGGTNATTLTGLALGSSTATTQLALDNSTKLATTAYVDRIGNSINNQRIGTIFSNSFSSPASYTQVHTSGTQTFNSGYVELAGNAGNFTGNYMAYIYNDTVGTLFQDYTLTSKFISTVNSSNTYGFGLGLYQFTNNTFAAFISTKSATTRGTVYILDPVAGTVFVTSTTQLVYTNSTDTIQVEVRFQKSAIFVTVKNLTTTIRTESGVSVPNEVTVQYAFAINVSPTTCRAGEPAIWTYGGTQDVYNLSMSSEEFQNPQIVIMGDSRVVGLGASTINRTYSQLTGFNTTRDKKSIIWAKGGVTLTALANGFSELSNIIKGEKTYMIIIAGINDIAHGQTLAQIQADYLTLIQEIQAIGCIPIPTKIAYVATGYPSAPTINTLVGQLNTWIGTLGLKTLDENTSTTTGGAMTAALTTDGIHFNDWGNIFFAKQFQPQIATLYQTKPDFSIMGWFDFTSVSSVVGWASFTYEQIQFRLSPDGTSIDVWYSINGTSNSTSTTFTLPFSSADFGSATYDYSTGENRNNSVFSTTPALLEITNNSNVATFYNNASSFAGAWTNINAKTISGFINTLLIQ